MIVICNLCKYSEESCICSSDWSEFKDLIEYKIENDLNPSTLRISTMTMVFKMSNCKIDINELFKTFQSTKIFTKINFTKGGKKSRNLEKNNVMYNQCELKGNIREFPKKCNKIDCKKKDCCKKTNLSLMIFKNGSFKMTGLKKVQNIPKIIRHIDNMIKSKKILSLIEQDKNCIIKDVRITMVNSDFTINKNINQYNLNEILNRPEYNISNPNGQIVSSSLDKDKYLGINTKHVYREKMDKEMKIINKKKMMKDINKKKSGRRKADKKLLTRKGRVKYPGQTSILTFDTGKIIITGGNMADEMLDAYKFINKILIENKESVCF